MAPVVRVPRHPPRPLTPELRNLLISGLLSSSAIQTLNTSLLSSCQVNGWLDAVKERAAQLIRSGKCSTYEQVMAALMEESKLRLAEKVVSNGLSSGVLVNGGRASDSQNEVAERNWHENDKCLNGGHEWEEKVDVTIPNRVIEDGKRFVKEALDHIVVIEESE
ncbi:hypothetical protein MMC22_006106 [Lobaria immixta]|nr:hypothetical protein [Lobaria immixta]